MRFSKLFIWISFFTWLNSEVALEFSGSVGKCFRINEIWSSKVFRIFLTTGCSERDRVFLIYVTTIKFTYSILLYEGKFLFSFRPLYYLFSPFPCININCTQIIAMKSLYISMCIFTFVNKTVYLFVIYSTKTNPALLVWTHSHIYLPKD